MIDDQTFESLLASAYEWAREQEKFILARGAPLGRRECADARKAGVQDSARVRVLVVDRIPMPEDQELADAARRNQILTEASRGFAIGYGVVIRADCWGDRKLLAHQLVHVAQCERSGGLEQYLHQYLRDRRTCTQFTTGSFEAEAQQKAHEICCPATPANLTTSIPTASNIGANIAPAKS